MIITHHREKLVNAIIYFAKNTRYCGKTKLMKLLFFLDFCHFKQTGKSVTGLDYYAWERGPVPKDLFEELDAMKPDLKAGVSVVASGDFQKITPKKTSDRTYFTKRELELLEKLSVIFRDARADDMIEVTHLKNEPWHKTLAQKGLFSKIDYFLAIDGAMDSLSLDEAKERMSEISEMHKMFGTF
jgi:uncharacterized phage-associated protein